LPDAIQETILNVYRGIKKLREPDFFRTWLFRILIRECQLISRKSKKKVPAEQVQESGAVDNEPDLDLREAVNRLDEPLRTIVKLHYYADLSLPQISEMLDISEGTLNSRLHRARGYLARWLSYPQPIPPGKENGAYEFH
jgi:RNA polymerase sigma factor (sigma-70 family)